MKVLGRITNVYFERYGSGLSREALAGETSVFVDSNVDFDENGGVCDIEGETYDYVFGVEGTEEDELIISPPLTVDLLQGTPVSTVPVTDVKMASVAVSDDEGLDGEDLVCEIHHSLTAMLTDGIREHGAGESVEVSDQSNGVLQVINVLGEEGVLLAGRIVGVNPDNPMTDGLAPENAPVTTVATFATGAVRVSWVRISNPDPVTYSVYASATTPVALDEAHLVGVTTGDSLTVSKTADGLPLSFTQDTYFQVVPSDADGVGPAGNEVTGRPRQASDPDISSDYAYVGEIEAGQIKAGKIFSDFAELDRFQSGSVDPRVIIDNSGILGTDPGGETRFSVPTDPDLPAEFRGKIETDSVTVVDRLTLRGQQNEFSKGGRVTMAYATSKPTVKPSISVEFPSRPVDIDTTWIEGGMKRLSDGNWYSYRNLWGIIQIFRRTENADGSLGPGVLLIEDGSDETGSTVQRLGVHDFIEHNGKILVLCSDSLLEDLWYNSKVRLRVYNMTTGAYERQVSVTIPLSDKKAALTSTDDVANGVRVIRADMNAGHRWKVHTFSYDPTTTVVTTGSIYQTPLISNDHISSFQELTQTAMIGSGAAARWIAKREGFATLYSLWSGSTSAARFTAEEWNSPGGTGVGSAWFDGARWHAWNQDKIWHLTDFTWSGWLATQTWAAKFSWFDGNTDGTGQHETLASPEQTFAMQKFAHVRVTTQALPAVDDLAPNDSVTGVRIYKRKVGGTALRSATDLPQDRTTTTALFGLPHGLPWDTSGGPSDTGAPPGFPSSTPFELVSAQGGFIVRGDGTGAWPLMDEVIAPAGCLRRSDPINIANNTWTKITFQTTEYHRGDIAWNGTNHRHQITKAGLYTISGTIMWSVNTAGRRGTAINVNGVQIAQSLDSIGGEIRSTSVSKKVVLAVGDYVEMFGFQNSGVAAPGLPTYPSSTGTWFEITREGA